MPEKNPNNQGLSTNLRDGNVNLLYANCWLTAVLYPGWSLFMKVSLPREYDAPFQRIAVGFSMLMLGLVSYKSAWVRRHFETLVYIGFHVVALHFWYLVYRADVSTVYVVGAMIVAVCYNLCFYSRGPIFSYSVWLLLLSVGVAMWAEGPIDHKLMLIAGIFTVQITSVSSCALRLGVLKILEEERLRSVHLKDRLVEKELESAEAVQKTLLIAAPRIDGVDIESYYLAAHRVGGDWFGYHYDEKRHLLYTWIGDVMGHGVSSALVTGVAFGALYSGEKRADSLKDDSSVENRLLTAATIMNEVICSTGGNLWMTMLFCALDVETGRFHFVNAGHLFPILCHLHGKRTEIISRGDPLGASRDLQFKVSHFDMVPGDALFLYTDGLIENNTKESPHTRLRQVRKGLAGCRTSAEIIHNVLQELGSEQGEGADDVSLLALTWNGTRSKKRAAG